MARSIYISSVEGHSGKSAIALGVLDTLAHSFERIGVFRPVARASTARDWVLELLLRHDSVHLDYEDCVGVTYETVHDDPEAALGTIVERFKQVERDCDAMVVIGSDYTDVATPTELGFNARVAANLGASVVLVLTGRAVDENRARTPEELAQIAELSIQELQHEHARLLAVITNRADPDRLADIAAAVGAEAAVPSWAIPEDPLLVAPSVGALVDAVGGTLIRGDEALLQREALGVVVAAMSMENVLQRLTEGALVMVAGDRAEVVLGVLTAHQSATFPSLSGLLLNGGFELTPTVARLLEGVESGIPIATTVLETYPAAQRLAQVRGRLTPDRSPKVDTALALFEQHVDTAVLMDAVGAGEVTAVTPLMFEYGLLERARAEQRHLVLPEGGDDRILLAASTVLARGIARLTILGDESAVRSRAAELGADLAEATVLSPTDPELAERFAAEYAARRAHRGVTLDDARQRVTDVSYFGTMMVVAGLADGMVSGAAHTTAHTITPSLEVIKTVPGVATVSSVFFMALDDRVLVYGDCAIVPDPTAEQLADIAVSSADTGAAFGIEPRVAMLSYSTGESGSGAEVDKVRAATELVRQRRPDLPVEGPIQYDAAIDAAVAEAKLPGSAVAGRATVFVFPDLNTGNNTYKAVQRSAGAVAIGPILQGLRRPVNDLSRGATVRDIVNTIAITAIQAQSTPPGPLDDGGVVDATGPAADRAATGDSGPDR